VELTIVATENRPFVSLEYGVTKSLYSDQWEGELDVKHANLFGGGEVAAINIRKGKNSRRQKVGSVFKNWKHEISSVNWRASVKDDNLGSSDSGYDVEIFRDHVGAGGLGDVIDEINGEETIVSPLRTGVTMKLRLPHSRKYSISLPKALSARFEYIDPYTKNDSAQCMTSMSADIGPYRNIWNESTRPLRSTVSAIAAAGRKWNIDCKSEKDNNDDASRLPYYATGTITSQQIMPLSSERESFPPIDLVIRNVASTSTRYLPRHEAIMLGLTSRIRGYKYNNQQNPERYQQQDTEKSAEKNLLQGLKNLMQGKSNNQLLPPVALTKAISGTVEVRIPFERCHPNIGRGNVVLFGDWCFSQAQAHPSLLVQHPGNEGDASEETIRFSSLGIGLRKVVQGIPLKVDACLTEHGTKGVFFGIGNN
jgi:outer membrane protein assembly factor BamA